LGQLKYTEIQEILMGKISPPGEGDRGGEGAAQKPAKQALRPRFEGRSSRSIVSGLSDATTTAGLERALTTVAAAPRTMLGSRPSIG
jgi:hypothetical protein